MSLRQSSSKQIDQRSHELKHLIEFLDYLFKFNDPQLNCLLIDKNVLKNFKSQHKKSYELACKLITQAYLTIDNVQLAIIRVLLYLDDNYLNELNTDADKIHSYLKLVLKEGFRINNDQFPLDDLYGLLSFEVKISEIVKKSSIRRSRRLKASETEVLEEEFPVLIGLSPVDFLMQRPLYPTHPVYDVNDMVRKVKHKEAKMVKKVDEEIESEVFETSNVKQNEIDKIVREITSSLSSYPIDEFQTIPRKSSSFSYVTDELTDSLNRLEIENPTLEADLINERSQQEFLESMNRNLVTNNMNNLYSNISYNKLLGSYTGLSPECNDSSNNGSGNI